MKGELLWVYEGLTDYQGEVLASRSGLVNPEQFRDRLALTAADMEYRSGRTWRPLLDTTVAAQVLYGSRGSSWTNWRRGVDFYSRRPDLAGCRRDHPPAHRRQEVAR